jgi:hypothetical protein
MATESPNTYLNGLTGNHASGTAGSASNPQSADPSPEEVGWYFVESYYNTMSKSPDKLYLFFKEKSQFAAGVEEEKVHVYVGQKVRPYPIIGCRLLEN